MNEIQVYDRNNNPITELRQYDRDVLVHIREPGVTSAVPVHFFNRNSKQALVVKTEFGSGTLKAKIPNILLEDDLPVTGYLYVTTDTESRSLYGFTITVRHRPIPGDFVHVESKDYITLSEIEESCRKYAENANTAKTGAESAKQAAETAKNDAVSAKNAANTANTQAKAAQAAAEKARDTANSAASTATTQASAASTSAGEASKSATAAAGSAATAKSEADKAAAAKTAAETAKTGATAAQTAAEAAKTTATQQATAAGESAKAAAASAATAKTDAATATTAKNDAVAAKNGIETARDAAVAAQKAAEKAKADVEALKYRKVEHTINVADWQGSASPYTATISVPNLTATQLVFVHNAMNLTAAQITAFADAGITAGAQAAGQITLKAVNKPTVALPIVIEMGGDIATS